MLINELSKQTGVSIPTLRYYENYGLFEGLSNDAIKTNNYKQYEDKLVAKIEWIKEAKKAGFTLSEIKKLLESWYNNQISTEQKVGIIKGKIDEIDEKINQLKSVKKYLVRAIKDVENGDC
jgi:MerR family transcriptional regulator, copper efflux regulator